MPAGTVSSPVLGSLLRRGRGGGTLVSSVSGRRTGLRTPSSVERFGVVWETQVTIKVKKNKLPRLGTEGGKGGLVQDPALPHPAGRTGVRKGRRDDTVGRSPKEKISTTEGLP